MIYASTAALAFLVITIFGAIIIYLSKPKSMWHALLEASGLAIRIIAVLVLIACLAVDWAEHIKFVAVH